MPTAESKSNWKRGFWSVWATQFQESFSDNAYKFLVISFVTGRYLAGDRDYLTMAAGILFAAPFVLFSPAGGYLADCRLSGSAWPASCTGCLPAWRGYRSPRCSSLAGW